MQSVETDKFRVTNFLFIGILVCVPLLALYHFGFFPRLASWLGTRLPRLLVLPEDGVEPCRILQYSYYTGAAFFSAWLGLSLRAFWQKLAFLLGFSYITLGLTVALAWSGILFEPFSGIGAAWVACLGALVVTDLGHSSHSEVAELVLKNKSLGQSETKTAPVTDSNIPADSTPSAESKPATETPAVAEEPAATAAPASAPAPAIVSKHSKGKPGQGSKKGR